MGSLGEAVLDLTADPSKLDPGLNSGKSKITGTLDGMKGQLSSFGTFAGTMMGNLVANAVTSIAGSITGKLKSSMQEFMNYATQVRETSRALGVSAEEASRLIQVADDLTISYETLSLSMKIAQRDGISPTIEGLAKLADEYTALAPGTERMQFLLDKFGKSGAEMGKLLEKGGDGIRQMSDAIDESMILTQEAIENARDYEIAVDALSDAWDGFIYKIAPPLIKATTDIINGFRDQTRVAELLREQGIMYGHATREQADAAMAQAVAEREAADAILRTAEANESATKTFDDSTKSIDGNKAAVNAATKAYDDFKDRLEKISRANQEAERFTRNYAESQNQYTKDHAKAVEDLERAENDLQEARRKGATDETIDRATESVNEARQAIKELEADWHKSTQQMIYDMVLAKVSVDGLTDSEFKATQDLAVQMGLITKEQAEAAKKAMEMATSLADGIALQEDVMRENNKNTQELKRLEEQKQLAIEGTTDTAVQGANTAKDAQVSGAQQTEQAVSSAAQTQTQAVGTVTDATMNEVNAQKILQAEVRKTTVEYRQMAAAAKTVPATGTGKAQGNGGTGGGSGGGAKKRDSGGKGNAGDMYFIGTGAQPELFIPDSNGEFLPKSEWVSRMRAAFENIGNAGAMDFMKGYKDKMPTSSMSSQKTETTNNRSMQNNINIYNPAPEPASQSVDGTLKKMSYLGVIK